MNKKYFWIYYIESIITFLLLAFVILEQIESYEWFGIDLGFGDFTSSHLFLTIITIFSFILFVVITIFLIKRKKYYINSLLFPISYIIFLVFILFMMYLFSYRVINNMHVMYYYTFVMFDYLLLNIYTVVCVNK